MTTSTVGKIVSSNGVDPSNVTFQGAPGSLSFSVFRSAIPFIHLSTGSMGNNGALTGVTALPTTYSGGAWCLFPAGAIAAGVPAAATWYWVVFSSATAGTVFNSIYTSGIPTIGAQTAFVTTGPGAFTGSTTATDGPTLTLPANSLGPNGQIRMAIDYAMTNNANNKTAAAKIGGTSFLNETMSSDLGNMATVWFANAGATNVNKGWASGVSNVNSTRATTMAYTAIDTTAAVTIVAASLNKATATDNMIMERFNVEVIFGA